MKYVKLSLTSLLAGALTTAVLAAFSLLVLMATTPDVGVRADGYFGAVFFESVPVDAETFTVNVGVASPWPLVVSTLAIAAFIILVVVIFRWLRAYRAGILTGTA